MNSHAPGEETKTETREEKLERLLRFARNNETVRIDRIWGKIYHNAKEHAEALVCPVCEWLEEVDKFLKGE